VRLTLAGSSLRDSSPSAGRTMRALPGEHRLGSRVYRHPGVSVFGWTVLTQSCAAVVFDDVPADEGDVGFESEAAGGGICSSLRPMVTNTWNQPSSRSHLPLL
jgi:hypothetical protein